ncbi:hypothetical protein BZG36_00030 [Bifiguratus adelaidae]|uniref:Uncharacterized protein n=1 Tax=Bifiguratus adelaidae TaxID=1938954 RepID=A0A261Y8S7_9FUNG|nr:hypothetical protein BZG36_00030 [Bifiguratus adelaidae]
MAYAAGGPEDQIDQTHGSSRLVRTKLSQGSELSRNETHRVRNTANRHSTDQTKSAFAPPPTVQTYAASPHPPAGSKSTPNVSTSRRPQELKRKSDNTDSMVEHLTRITTKLSQPSAVGFEGWHGKGPKPSEQTLQLSARFKNLMADRYRIIASLPQHAKSPNVNNAEGDVTQPLPYNPLYVMRYIATGTGDKSDGKLQYKRPRSGKDDDDNAWSVSNSELEEVLLHRTDIVTNNNCLRSKSSRGSMTMMTSHRDSILASQAMVSQGRSLSNTAYVSTESHRHGEVSSNNQGSTSEVYRTPIGSNDDLGSPNAGSKKKFQGVFITGSPGATARSAESIPSPTSAAHGVQRPIKHEKSPSQSSVLGKPEQASPPLVDTKPSTSPGKRASPSKTETSPGKGRRDFKQDKIRRRPLGDVLSSDNETLWVRNARSDEDVPNATSQPRRPIWDQLLTRKPSRKKDATLNAAALEDFGLGLGISGSRESPNDMDGAGHYGHRRSKTHGDQIMLLRTSPPNLRKRGPDSSDIDKTPYLTYTGQTSPQTNTLTANTPRSRRHSIDSVSSPHPVYSGWRGIHFKQSLKGSPLVIKGQTPPYQIDGRYDDTRVVDGAFSDDGMEIVRTTLSEPEETLDDIQTGEKKKQDKFRFWRKARHDQEPSQTGKQSTSPPRSPPTRPRQFDTFASGLANLSPTLQALPSPMISLLPQTDPLNDAIGPIGDIEDMQLEGNPDSQKANLLPELTTTPEPITRVIMLDMQDLPLGIKELLEQYKAQGKLLDHVEGAERFAKEEEERLKTSAARDDKDAISNKSDMSETASLSDDRNTLAASFVESINTDTGTETDSVEDDDLTTKELAYVEVCPDDDLRYTQMATFQGKNAAAKTLTLNASTDTLIQLKVRLMPDDVSEHPDINTLTCKTLANQIATYEKLADEFESFRAEQLQKLQFLGIVTPSFIHYGGPDLSREPSKMSLIRSQYPSIASFHSATSTRMDLSSFADIAESPINVSFETLLPKIKMQQNQVVAALRRADRTSRKTDALLRTALLQMKSTTYQFEDLSSKLSEQYYQQASVLKDLDGDIQAIIISRSKNEWQDFGFTVLAYALASLAFMVWLIVRILKAVRAIVMYPRTLWKAYDDYMMQRAHMMEKKLHEDTQGGGGNLHFEEAFTRNLHRRSLENR